MIINLYKLINISVETLVPKDQSIQKDNNEWGKKLLFG